MPVMQIRTVRVFMLQRLMPVRVGMLSVFVHRRRLRAMDVIVVMEVIMGVAVRMAQGIMAVAVCMFL